MIAADQALLVRWLDLILRLRLRGALDDSAATELMADAVAVVR